MKKPRFMRRVGIALCALVACVAMVVGLLPSQTFADVSTQMTEGDVIAGFVPAGTACESSDPSVAWVDSEGNLKAMKAGKATVSDGEKSYEVEVADYEDGSEVVGRLKLLARYNDDMQFYDGHVYLLFTSYQDGVDITVNDLYGAYEISDQYYKDIHADISNGSNHTGTDADKYFTFTKDLKTMRLNRGQIVTIGMYRDFDMSIPEAALGSITKSTLFQSLSDAAKADIVDLLLEALQTKSIPQDELFVRLKAIAESEGLDYNQLLDGVVDGGVCFNRELYNQKLEWDQYENVTYELDITRNQLNALTMYLGGNLNKFSILKNSCATVALRAWNAAVGTRGGADTAYKLTPEGEGIFKFIDAPKTVRDSIVAGLPGYWLNNKDGGDPDAGYTDETGWVYVSAPAQVSPLAYAFINGSVRVDDAKSDMTALVNAAKEGSGLSYSEDIEEIGVEVTRTTAGDVTTVQGIQFTIEDNTVSVNEQNVPSGGFWLKAQVDPQEDDSYFVTDADGNALPSVYADGWISFHVSKLPVSYKVESGREGTRNVLKTTVVKPDSAKVQTEVYYYNGTEKVALGDQHEVASGRQVYVKSVLDAEDPSYVLSGITLNGASLMDSAHFDAGEGAYAFTMGETYSELTVSYEKAVVKSLQKGIIQTAAGSTLNVADYAEVAIGERTAAADELCWKIIDDKEEVLAYVDGSQTGLMANKAGSALVWAGLKSNENVGIVFSVEVYESTDNMSPVSFNTEDITVEATNGESTTTVPFSGYLVQNGSTIKVTPIQQDDRVVSAVSYNGAKLGPGETLTVDGPTEIAVGFRKATIAGMPSSITLASKGDTYQLKASVRYSGIIEQFLPVYDPSLTYESSDPLIEVSETGNITLAGEVPTEGKAVYVTAYAGSSNGKVFGTCKVIVGKYDGARIVGRLTINARTIVANQLVAHGAATFAPYEDMDVNVSYYNYYKPTYKYLSLLWDYDTHPEKYTSDPALYMDNELGLENREAYFEEIHHGAGAEASVISLKRGDCVSMSNYAYEDAFTTIVKTLENSVFTDSDYVSGLIEQMRAYQNGEEVDGVVAFDDFVSTLVAMYRYGQALGYNPADGHTEGGLDVNRELYNQFRQSDSQLPNNFYTVELTADEFAAMERYISDPNNNYYTLFNKNCASGAVDIWNATLADRPELQISANYTGLATDPQSLYVALGLLQMKTGKTFEKGVAGKEEGGGKDFYPRMMGRLMFTDVDETTAHEEDIYWLAESGISEGWKHEDGTAEFRPYANIARADMAAFLFRLARNWRLVDDSWQPSGSKSFTDVDEQTPHYREVMWLAESGISEGWKREDGTAEFRPYADIARADMAAFIARLQRLNGGATKGEGEFTDVTDETAHAEDIRWLAAAGISEGWRHEDGTAEFRPFANVARADMAAFLHRLDGLK